MAAAPSSALASSSVLSSVPSSTLERRYVVAVIGNPNTGKTTLFNALTGLTQHTGNYPGVTVESAVGEFTVEGTHFLAVDLPGTYSLAPRAPDEMIAVKVLLGSSYVTFASPDIAERLAGSVAGTILPFSFNDELELVVDPSLLENDEIYFNAARLDRSMMLKTRDYVAVAKPRLGHIAKGR